ncbi:MULTISPECIES: cyclic-di-AMP-binding protein CbpB [Lactobacillus]|uniref:CBS domain-containing protein n=2 Tax=Lactobacillus panisapium TaxID=2012495 RepID=A0ABX8W827_9LACO|nr:MULTISPECIES: cyclic-di-AMP-binding protein CbpB [Lactobacillus]MCO6533610.1 CBS domain-containing protein [Lactobacillus sp.]MCO6536112.1 CBS domain-containing protein [Lactobacillus sp.]MCX8724967.1 CBS domain-containing protein [Lactobacillus sp. B4007]QYN53754.1 CBS domain-containing protein [Lactobacillus panisapium]QYN59523.1 CBS domain-containing protein [Lactobacillus panisapium]
MFSPSIQHLLEEKSGSFIIPATRIAFVEDDNPLYHAFLILTKVKYSKIPVLDRKSRVVGLLSLAMITDKMMTTDSITLEPLNQLKVRDVMQTEFDKINFAQTTLETQLHLLVDNAFLPVIDDYGVFQGLLTRREWIKAFNYVAHNFEQKYEVLPKKITINKK